MKFYLEESVITEDIRELTIIITTRHWGATYAYAAHEAQALASGLTPALVAAVMAQENAHRGHPPRALRSPGIAPNCSKTREVSEAPSTRRRFLCSGRRAWSTSPPSWAFIRPSP